MGLELDRVGQPEGQLVPQADEGGVRPGTFDAWIAIRAKGELMHPPVFPHRQGRVGLPTDWSEIRREYSRPEANGAPYCCAPTAVLTGSSFDPSSSAGPKRLDPPRRPVDYRSAFGSQIC